MYRSFDLCNFLIFWALSYSFQIKLFWITFCLVNTLFSRSSWILFQFKIGDFNYLMHVESISALNRTTKTKSIYSMWMWTLTNSCSRFNCHIFYDTITLYQLIHALVVSSFCYFKVMLSILFFLLDFNISKLILFCAYVNVSFFHQVHPVICILIFSTIYT